MHSTSYHLCSQVQSPLVFPEPPDVLTTSRASQLTCEPKTVSPCHSASSLDQSLHLTSSSTAQNLNSVTVEESKLSVGSYTDVDIFPASNLSSQNSQPKCHLVSGGHQQDAADNSSEIKIPSAADSTSLLPIDSVSIKNDAFFRTTQESIQQSRPAQLPVSEPLTTMSLYSDRPSLSYPTHVYTSFGSSTSRKYSNVSI